jgi:hypothetical protein
MTSYNALLVVLEAPLHEDHVERLRDAIVNLRGVLSVEVAAEESTEIIVARMQIRKETQDKLWEAFFKPRP